MRAMASFFSWWRYDKVLIWHAHGFRTCKETSSWPNSGWIMWAMWQIACEKSTSVLTILGMWMYDDIPPEPRTQRPFSLKPLEKHQFTLTNIGTHQNFWNILCARWIWILKHLADQNYFTSKDPHHGIYTFSYWQIFWHSIWHIFWHSIWHIFWHMFWHSIWQIFWHSIWHIFWHSIWHIFWHSIWHIFWHSIWHIFWHSIWHSIWHIFWHSIWPLRSGSAHWDLELVVEVRQCPLRPGSRGWGPAVPTAIWKSRLRSGSAHCDLEIAVEVRQCPLGSGARGWGPAVPTAIWSSRWRSGSAHWDLELAVEVRLCPLGSGLRGGGEQLW